MTTRKKWIIGLSVVGVIALIAAAVLFIAPSLKAQASTADSGYETEIIGTGNLSASIGATGSLRSAQSATVNWDANGIVGSVLVSEGDAVRAGQTLAKLDPESLPQSIILAEADLVSAQKTLDDLRQSTKARAQAELDLVNARQKLEDAQKEVESKKYQRATQDTIDLARADLVQAENALEQAEGVFNIFSDRHEDDPERAAALSQLANARKAKDQAYYNLNYVMGMPDELEVSKSQANLDIAEAEVADAQRAFDRVKDGPNADDIRAAEARVAAAEVTLSQASVEAPFAAVVTYNGSLVGDVVSPGSKAFRLDDLSRLLVDITVSEVDINQVKVGQSVSLSFDAAPGVEYHAEVTRVASVPDSGSTGANYTVTAELLDADDHIRPGMTAAVTVVVAEKQGVTLVPNRAVRVVNGQRVVYVLRGGALQTATVELGASDNLYSEVTGGDLKQGDQVVLNPPSQIMMGGGGAMVPGGR